MEQDAHLALGHAGAAAASWEADRAARREAEAAADRLARLQSVTAALSGARTPDEVAAVALAGALEALGAAAGAVLVARPRGELHVLRSAGEPDEAARAIAVARGTPAHEPLRAGQPVFAADGGTSAALPLAVAGRTLGVLALAFDRVRPFPDAERAFAVALAGVSAQALDRARLLVDERVARAEAVAARGRLAFLDGLSAHLAETAGRAEMLDGVARLAVPALGEWVGIYLPNDAGGVSLVAQRGPAALAAAVDAHLRKGGSARIERPCGCADIAVVDDVPAGEGEPAVGPVRIVPLCLAGRSLGALAVASANVGASDSDTGFLADVAHRTALALEHARLLEEATAAARAREEFLHVASHELRGPIATLKLAVHLLRRDARAGNPDAYEARLQVLDRQVARLLGLSETLLDVSRITGGRLELAREEEDLAAIARDVAARFADDAAEQGSTVAVDAPCPVRCAVDASRIDQVISNLVSNAVKYGRGGAIRVSVRGDDRRVRVEVEDRGIGIAPEDQARIFGRFERAVSARTHGGLGLGLWIVKRLVEAHGGTVRVRSAPGEGSTFTVELPR